jgi:hypothetical protein
MGRTLSRNFREGYMGTSSSRRRNGHFYAYRTHYTIREGVLSRVDRRVDRVLQYGVASRIEGGDLQNTRDLIAAYADAGLKMVRVSREAKRAVDKGWQRRETLVSPSDALAWVEGGENLGLQCGDQSGGLAVAECDSTYARALAGEFLPETLTAAKEGEEIPAHYFYLAEGAEYRKVKNVEGGEVLSLKTSARGRGHYVVVEPSIHPSKGRYEFHGGFDAEEIARVSADDLEMRVAHLGAAAIVAEYVEGGGIPPP